MKKKALRYFIIFFVVPLIVSIIIGIVSNVSKNNNSSDMSYHKVDYSNVNNTSVKSNNTYIYLSVFCFVVMGFGVLLYINKKEF